MYRVIGLFLGVAFAQLCVGASGPEGGAKLGSSQPADKVVNLHRVETGSVEVYFRAGSSRLTRHSLSDLRRSLKRLQESISSSGETTLVISGYTGGQGSSEFALGLAAVRCERVRQYLMGRGIPRTRLRPVSLGLEQNLPSPLTDESVGGKRPCADVVQISVATAGEW